MIINDGKGTGYAAGINAENRLLTSSICATPEHQINHSKGLAFQAYFAVNPAGADDVIFYILNNDNIDIVIEGITINTSAAEEIEYGFCSGTAVATSGASLVPVNLNAGSGNTADITCYGNTADGAVDITGLTRTRIERIWLAASETTFYYNFEADLILPKNKAFYISAVGGDTLLRGSVLFTFHDPETI